MEIIKWLENDITPKGSPGLSAAKCIDPSSALGQEVNINGLLYKRTLLHNYFKAWDFKEKGRRFSHIQSLLV